MIKPSNEARRPHSAMTKLSPSSPQTFLDDPSIDSFDRGIDEKDVASNRRMRPFSAIPLSYGRWTIFRHPVQVDHGKLLTAPKTAKPQRLNKISSVYGNMLVFFDAFIGFFD